MSDTDIIMGDEPVDEPVSPPINPVLDHSLPPWLSLPPKKDEFSDGVRLLQHAHASGANKYERLMPSMSDYPPGWPGPKPNDDAMGLLPMNVVSYFKSPAYTGERDAIGSLPNPDSYAVQMMEETSHMRTPVVSAEPRKRTKKWADVRRKWEQEEAMKQGEEEGEQAERKRDQQDMDYEGH